VSDVVYVVGPDREDQQLRYSLRSLAAHVDHDQVWIAGHCPDWVTNVWHIDVEQNRGPRLNTLRNVMAAIRCDQVSDPFQLWCDDFYAMQPIGQLPVMTRGPITHSELRNVAAYLHQQGVAEPWAYDALHVPQWYDKAGLLHAIHTGQSLYATIYGNLHREDHGDVVPNAKNPEAWQDRAWLSTNGTTWAGPMGDHIRATFTEPCVYEVS